MLRTLKWTAAERYGSLSSGLSIVPLLSIHFSCISPTSLSLNNSRIITLVIVALVRKALVHLVIIW